MSYNTVGIIKNGVKQKLPVVMVAPKVDGPDYAEVVADGVKTYATLFTELASLVDNTKVNPKSVFTIDSDVYVARYYEELIFYNAQISSAKSYVVEARIQSHMFIEVEAGATYQDMSNNVPTSGRKFTLYYNTATLDLTTRASNCVYDNSNSGLSATDAQGAIDEVVGKVNRGSVSVTADGADNYSAILASLYSQADNGKVTKDSVLVIGELFFYLRKKSTSRLEYVCSECGSTYVGVTEAVLASSGAFYDSSITANNTNVVDNSTRVPSSGTNFTLFY